MNYFDNILNVTSFFEYETIIYENKNTIYSTTFSVLILCIAVYLLSLLLTYINKCVANVFKLIFDTIKWLFPYVFGILIANLILDACKILLTYYIYDPFQSLTQTMRGNSILNFYLVNETTT